MKNVQYYLNYLNLEELVDTYFNRIKNFLLNEIDKDVSINKLSRIMKDNIKMYINKLQKIPLKESENQSILLAYEGFLFETTTEPVFVLIHEKELIENKNDLSKVETYAYELSPNEEIMGYLISESEYTQKYIYDLIADVLYEASFFGYDETKKLEVRKELQYSVKEIEEGILKTKSWEDCKKELFSDVYIYEKDEYQSELMTKIIADIGNYNRYSLIRELSNLLKELNCK